MDYRNYYVSFFEFHELEVDDEFLGKIDELSKDLNWSESDIRKMQEMSDVEEVQNFFFYAFGAKQVREKLGWELPESMKWWDEIELPLPMRSLRSIYSHFVHNIMQFQTRT
nr:hypothetical protein K-LCC10_0451 [Kaumoebavirus]